jgi:hypothetical protein
MFSFRRAATVLVALGMLVAPALFAQVTTGNIGGNVTTKQDNSVLRGSRSKPFTFRLVRAIQRWLAQTATT